MSWAWTPVSLIVALAGCSPVSSESSDTGRGDAQLVDASLDSGDDILSDAGPGDCTWSPPPGTWATSTQLGGDLATQTSCGDWALATTSNSTLVALTVTLDNGCAPADHCDESIHCSCGGAAPCADGSICAEELGTGVVHCVACARAP